MTFKITFSSTQAPVNSTGNIIPTAVSPSKKIERQSRMSAHVLDINVVHSAFQNLLTSLTPEQKVLFAQQLHIPPSLNLTIVPEANLVMAREEATKQKRAASASPKLQKAIRAKSRQVEGQKKGRKRPTNSFIAFRAYYSPQLRGQTQKTKSGLIRQMWQAEPRKHFFALLAKAHSELRDNHREPIGFDKFLTTAAALLPIIPADIYLSKMGWEVTVGPEGEAAMSRIKLVPDNQDYAMTTNVLVQDILEHCYTVGLATRPVCHLRRETPSMESAMIMSFVAAPRSRASTTGDARASVSNIPRTISISGTCQYPKADWQQFDPVIRQRLEAPVATQPPEFDFNDLWLDYRPSMQIVTTDQQQAFGTVPFNYHFHPDVPALVGSEPNMIQNEFDPFSFDLGDFVNTEF